MRNRIAEGLASHGWAIPDDEREALRQQLITEQEHESGGVRRGLDIGVVDEVIDPTRTRQRLAEALAATPIARGQHGNIPL